MASSEPSSRRSSDSKASFKMNKSPPPPPELRFVADTAGNIQDSRGSRTERILKRSEGPAILRGSRGKLEED